MALGLLALGLGLGMYISYFLCRFHLRLVVNAKPVSSGIWALLGIFGVKSRVQSKGQALNVLSKMNITLTLLYQ